MAAHGVFGELSPFFNSLAATFLAERRRFASFAILKFCLVICFAQNIKRIFGFLFLVFLENVLN